MHKRIISDPRVSALDVKQITRKQSEHLDKGDVILVRSNYKHRVYGDHFSLIVGGLILKERGVRPNLITFPPSQVNSALLDLYTPDEGAVILLLKRFAAEEVLNAYGVHLSEGDLFAIKNQ